MSVYSEELENNEELDYGSNDDDDEKVNQPQNKEFNFKCANFKCKNKFYLDKKSSQILCPQCGHRILYKLRTKNCITYKAE
jgi:DNA-directed RNA polymerase subunit RPC12/RpoP